jgi:hypothetical protein
MLDGIEEVCGSNKGRAAFLSTPSLYFTLPASQRQAAAGGAGHAVFDYDDVAFGSDPGFVKYDFRKPLDVPEALHGTFDLVVIDPPFITEEVWKCYAQTANLLLKGGGTASGGAAAAAAASGEENTTGKGHALCTTVAENAALIASLFPGCVRQRFQPSIPHLVYQYDLYASWTHSKAFGKPNPEVPE